MLHWLKKRAIAWLEACQQRKIDCLHAQALRLKREVEQKTGRPVELTAQQRRRLAEKAKGIDPETLRRISVFDPEQLISDQESTENR